MSVMVWWLVPLLATAVAIVWTAVLRRRERRRADESWRAQRLAKVGGKLIDPTQTPQVPVTGPAAGLAPRPRHHRADVPAGPDQPDGPVA